MPTIRSVFNPIIARFRSTPPVKGAMEEDLSDKTTVEKVFSRSLDPLSQSVNLELPKVSRFKAKRTRARYFVATTLRIRTKSPEIELEIEKEKIHQKVEKLTKKISKNVKNFEKKEKKTRTNKIKNRRRLKIKLARNIQSTKALLNGDKDNFHEKDFNKLNTTLNELQIRYTLVNISLESIVPFAIVDGGNGHQREFYNSSSEIIDHLTGEQLKNNKGKTAQFVRDFYNGGNQLFFGERKKLFDENNDLKGEPTWKPPKDKKGWKAKEIPQIAKDIGPSNSGILKTSIDHYQQEYLGNSENLSAEEKERALEKMLVDVFPRRLKKFLGYKVGKGVSLRGQLEDNQKVIQTMQDFAVLAQQGGAALAQHLLREAAVGEDGEPLYHVGQFTSNQKYPLACVLYKNKNSDLIFERRVAFTYHTLDADGIYNPKIPVMGFNTKLIVNLSKPDAPAKIKVKLIPREDLQASFPSFDQN